MQEQRNKTEHQEKKKEQIFKVSDRVRVRQFEEGIWYEGTVTGGGTSPTVLIDDTTMELTWKFTEMIKHELMTLDFGPMEFGIDFCGNLVQKVKPNSQAANLGVEVGWKIVSVNGTDVLNSKDAILKEALQTKDANKPTTFVFNTHGLVTLKFGPDQFGINFIGNLVHNVLPNTQADALGVKVGWKIVSVNGIYMPNDKDAIMKEALRTRDANEPTVFCFQTEHTPPTTTVTTTTVEKNTRKRIGSKNRKQFKHIFRAKLTKKRRQGTQRKLSPILQTKTLSTTTPEISSTTTRGQPVKINY